MSRKAKDFLNSKMQVELPEKLSKDNILDNINNSEAEIIELPKKKNIAKKLVPMVASLFLVIGIVGIYMNSQQKEVPVANGSTEVLQYQSYDKIYEKFDTLHMEYKKNNFFDNFFYVDEEEFYIEDGVAMDDAVAGDTAVPESAPGNTNGSSTSTDINSSLDRDYGTTNTQEKDVDEGDIIKTDGNYLYIVNAENKSISIVDVTGEKMTEASQIDFDNTEIVEEIYIADDKLVVIGHLRQEIKANGSTYSKYEIAVDCIGYVDADAFVKIYDIADRKALKLLNEYSQQGGYRNSRMIGTKLYVISTYYVDVYSDDYRDKCIPEITVDDTCEKVPADSIYLIEESKSESYAVITTLDVNENTAKPECTAILGDCGDLYASSKGLFLCENAVDENHQEITKIYKFDYTDKGVEFKSAGKVNGYINDQFSMSYDGEYFRIATTFDKVTVDGDSVSMNVDDRVNNLYILNNDMEIVGKVEDLAKGEQIESVRFVGNMAYVVTFRQTDPLFVIDLTDPENPTVKGELKIPGFSEYLHPIADGLLVGVGQDGTMSGVNGDCKVSLFDVSDPYEPKESSVLNVTGGKGYCYSLVSYNHKVYVTLSENEFAVPFSVNSYVIDKSEMGDYYIRYELNDNSLREVARYDLGEVDSIMGATYVEDVFYVVTNHYEKGTIVTAFSLTSNEQIDSVKL